MTTCIFYLCRNIEIIDRLPWPFRRTRSQTMSERLRKSIRQKLRPSIFTVDILKISNTFIKWFSSSEKFRLSGLHAGGNRRKNELFWRTMWQMWKISSNSVPCQLLDFASNCLKIQIFSKEEYFLSWEILSNPDII